MVIYNVIIMHMKLDIDWMVGQLKSYLSAIINSR